MTILDDVDRLYEAAVTEPETVNPQMIADWSESIATSQYMDRQAAKYVRRCITAARKLTTFWAERDSASDVADWSTRVDLSLGERAWRPQLDLSLHLLDTAPEFDVFDKTTQLFRLVHHEPFLDGISYENWLESRQM